MKNPKEKNHHQIPRTRIIPTTSEHVWLQNKNYSNQTKKWRNNKNKKTLEHTNGTNKKKRHTLLHENLEPAPSPEPELVPVVIRYNQPKWKQHTSTKTTKSFFFSWNRKMEEEQKGYLGGRRSRNGV